MVIPLSVPRAVSLSVLILAAARPGSAGAGDNFAEATVLSGAAAGTVENNANATMEPGDPNPGHRSLWWTWTAPANGRASVVNTGGGDFSKELRVWLPKAEPAEINGLALIGEDGERVNFPVVQGTKYYFSGYSSFASGAGDYKMSVLLDSDTDINQLTIQGAALFSNDFFARRAALTGAAAAGVAYNPSATNEAASQEPENGNRTMWWTWTAPEAGTVTFSAQAGDEFTQTMCVFEGTALPELVRIAEQNGTRPRIILPVTAGAVYQISLGSTFASGSGSMVLSVSLDTAGSLNGLPFGAVATAANDAFAKRTALTGTYVSAIGYGNYATREPLEPETGNGSLWWTWTAPAPGLVTLATEGSPSNTTRVLNVWTGGTLGSLTRTAQSSNDGKPTVSFTAETGQTYQISLGGVFASGKADTAVLTLNAPGKETPGLQVSPAVRLHWLSTAGTVYRIESSADLRTWTPTGDVITGDGTVKEVFKTARENEGYFRVSE